MRARWNHHVTVEETSVLLFCSLTSGMLWRKCKVSQENAFRMQARTSPWLLKTECWYLSRLLSFTFIPPCSFCLHSIPYITALSDMAFWISISLNTKFLFVELSRMIIEIKVMDWYNNYRIFQSFYNSLRWTFLTVLIHTQYLVNRVTSSDCFVARRLNVT